MKFKKMNVSQNKVEIELEGNDVTRIEVINESDFGSEIRFFINGIERDLDDEVQDKILNFINDNKDKKDIVKSTADYNYHFLYSSLTINQILQGYHNNKERAIKNIEKDLELFTKYEEYEKCIILTNIKKEIKLWKKKS